MRWYTGFEFPNIVAEHYEHFRRSDKRFRDLLDQDALTDKERLEQALVNMERRKNGYIVIAFAAFAVEGYIYDYAARKFSDSFAKKYIDRLDVRSKYVVVTKMATGKDFPTDGQAFELIGKLKRNRDWIAHVKSKPIPVEDELVDHASLVSPLETHDGLTQAVNNAVQCFSELIQVMEEIDPNEVKSARLYFRSID